MGKGGGDARPDRAPRSIPREDLDLLRSQAADALRTMVRPAAYAGAFREVIMSAFHLAAYPLGLVPGLRTLNPPAVLSRPELHPRLEADPVTAEMPVVLVHGWVHNRSAFLVMTRALERAGFAHVHSFNHNPLVQGVEELAALLGAEVERVLAASGASKVQLVGHSMGGMIARMYVQELGGEDTVDTVVTLGTPHRGTYTAHLGPGAGAADMRPRSPVLRRLEASARPSNVRWVAFYSDLDLMVTPAINAKLVHPALQAHNIRLRDTGHLSLLLSGEVLRGIVDLLADPDLHRPERLSGVTALPTAGQRRRRDGRPHLTVVDGDASAASATRG